MMLLLAVSPIVAILIGMVIMKKSAMYVAPIVTVYAIILSLIFFQTDINTVIIQSKSGIIEGIKIICLLWPAFIILKIMVFTGAIGKVKEVLSGVTCDKRAQLIIISSMFVTFLEGAAGAGSPAAIAGPFLVGLGFNPVVAAAASLLGDSTAASWGGAGLTTINGSSALIKAGIMTTAQSSAMVGRIHIFGLFLIPYILIYMAFGKKGFKNFAPFLIFSSLCTPTILFFISNFIGPELASLGTGVLSIAASVIFLKFYKLDTPEEYRYKKEEIPRDIVREKINYSSFQAFGPYIILSLALPIVRYSFPLSILAKYGYIMWVAAVVFVSSYLGGLILKLKTSSYLVHAKNAAINVFPALITISTLLVLSNIMKVSGMISIMANTIAMVTRDLYPAMSPVIGSLGAFITGTGLGSNIMFAPMHLEAATKLGLNPITIFAGQNAGASLGNLICTNNIIAVAITVDLIGREGEIMKKVFKPFFIIVSTYMVVTMLYTHIIFPTWGL